MEVKTRFPKYSQDVIIHSNNRYHIVYFNKFYLNQINCIFIKEKKIWMFQHIFQQEIKKVQSFYAIHSFSNLCREHKGVFWLPYIKARSLNWRQIHIVQVSFSTFKIWKCLSILGIARFIIITRKFLRHRLFNLWILF